MLDAYTKKTPKIAEIWFLTLLPSYIITTGFYKNVMDSNFCIENMKYVLMLKNCTSHLRARDVFLHVKRLQMKGFSGIFLAYIDHNCSLLIDSWLILSCDREKRALIAFFPNSRFLCIYSYICYKIKVTKFHEEPFTTHIFSW